MHIYALSPSIPWWKMPYTFNISLSRNTRKYIVIVFYIFWDVQHAIHHVFSATTSIGCQMFVIVDDFVISNTKVKSWLLIGCCPSVNVNIIISCNSHTKSHSLVRSLPRTNRFGILQRAWYCHSRGKWYSEIRFHGRCLVIALYSEHNDM